MEQYKEILVLLDHIDSNFLMGVLIHLPVSMKLTIVITARAAIATSPQSWMILRSNLRNPRD